MTAPGEGVSRAEGARVWAARAIRAHSIVRLPDGRIGYLEKNTGSADLWVVTEPGKTAVEVKRATRLEVIQNPLELAIQWVANHLKQREHDPD